MFGVFFGFFFTLIPRYSLTAPVVHCAGVSQPAQAEVSDLEDEATVHHTVGGGQVAVGMYGAAVKVVHALKQGVTCFLLLFISDIADKTSIKPLIHTFI